MARTHACPWADRYFRSPFELLVATVLSAQTTDLRVNQATPEELEEIIRPTGFFRAKAKSLSGLSAALRDTFGGEVPGRLEGLVILPGVGCKTANVVLGNAPLLALEHDIAGALDHDRFDLRRSRQCLDRLAQCWNVALV